MMAMPDPTTFAILPWRPSERRVARMFCDILHTDGTPFEGDPRYVLSRNLKRAADLGYTFYVGPELEYFYFANSETPEVLDVGGYFDLTPLDAGTDLRRETVLTLEELGIAVEASHHEVAPVPARDRPALHRRAHDGRQHDDLPPRRQGGRAQERRLRHVHAQAPARRERLRHARPPVALPRRAQRLLRRRRPLPPLRTRPQLHRRPAAPRQRDHAGHQPVGQLLQAPRPGLRGARLPLLGPPQPLRPHPRPRVQARQGERHAHRVPRRRPRLQPLPRLRRDARRRPGGHREGVPLPRSCRARTSSR